MSRKDIKYRGEKCLNCNTSLDLSEKYCHHCGQLNSTKKLSVKDFIEEFFANFYAYDSRLRNSFVSIFTKPGVLAKEFNQGKRHTFANPFRLFLSVSIILFISFNLTKDDYDGENENLQKFDTEEQITAEDSIALTKIKMHLNISENQPSKTYSKDSIYTKKEIDSLFPANTDPLVFTALSFRNYHRKYPNQTETEALKSLGYEDTFLNRAAYKKSKLFQTNDIEKEVFDYYYAKLPFFIFLSLPIVTLIFWIVFYSGKINYTEHLVFCYTFFTFMFLCMILINVLDFINLSAGVIFGFFCFLILFPYYLYRSLRNFYQQNRWITIIKFLLLNPLFSLILGICIIFMFFLGIILY